MKFQNTWKVCNSFHCEDVHMHACAGACTLFETWSQTHPGMIKNFYGKMHCRPDFLMRKMRHRQNLWKKVDPALLVWGPTLRSTHAPLTPWTHLPPSLFFSLCPPTNFSSLFPLFPLFSFGPFPFLFFLSSLTPFSFFPLFFWVCVCEYLRMYVRAYYIIYISIFTNHNSACFFFL